MGVESDKVNSIILKGVVKENLLDKVVFEQKS